MHIQCILQTYTVVVDHKTIFNIIVRKKTLWSEAKRVPRQLLNVIGSITIEKYGWIWVRVNSQKI
jgi:hypothetical protein